MSQTNFEENK